MLVRKWDHLKNYLKNKLKIRKLEMFSDNTEGGAESDSNKLA